MDSAIGNFRCTMEFTTLRTRIVDPDRASRIRIRHYFVWIQILPSKSKKSKKNLDTSYFVTSF